VVAHGWQFGASSTEVRRFAARVAEESTAARAHMLAVAAAFEEVDQNIEARVRSGLDQLGIPQSRLRMYDHHLCHAAAAVYFSPFGLQAQECCCVTWDGRGDFSSGKVVLFTPPPTAGTGGRSQSPKELQVIDSTSMFDSVGLLWAFVTAVLGFKPFRHEGKLTGLAAHGEAARTLPIFEQAMGLVQDLQTGRWQI
ncbi:unnamed protein product, partial [Polarella glacialis]